MEKIISSAFRLLFWICLTLPVAAADLAPPAPLFRDYDKTINEGRDSVIQVARLELKDGALACDRDASFQLDLKPEMTSCIHGGEAAE